MKRTAVVFTTKDKVDVIEEPVEALADDRILVETSRTLISTGTELICLGAKFAPGTHWAAWVKYPFRSGYLNAGRVLEVGKAVKDFKPGDRVACRWNHVSHFTYPAAQAMHIPDGVSDEDAAWFGLGKITQIGVRAADHKMGDVVAIVGLGLLGQLVTQYARIMGASQVIAIDMAPMRLEIAKKHGATHTLQMTAADALQPLKDITGGRGADIVYDITGFAPVFAQVLPLARNFSKVVLLGDTGTPQQQNLTHDIVTRGLRIVGAHDGHAGDPFPAPNFLWSGKEIYNLFFKYVERGQMRVSSLMTHRFKPQQAPEAFAMLQRERETAMGVGFEWK